MSGTIFSRSYYKKDNQPVPNLSKECNYPTTVYFRFKFEWIITARYVSINCAIRIKYISQHDSYLYFRNDVFHYFYRSKHIGNLVL